MWKMMFELSDMMKDKETQDILDLEAIDRAKQNRAKIYIYNDKIVKYLENKWLTIDKVTKHDVEEMTKDLKEHDKYIFIKQLVKAIETNYWKPIQWIKDNKKCVLFD